MTRVQPYGTNSIHSAFFRLLLSGALLMLDGPMAFAVKQAVQIVAPATAEESGFSIRVTREENGELAFRIRRDISKARSFPPDSELMTRRTATLKVYGSNGLLASCEVAADRDGNQVAYHFTVTEAGVPHSHFTLAEIGDYKDEKREHLIGGGAFYRINLSDFAQPSATARPAP